MPRTVCINCNLTMYVEQNGVVALECMDIGLQQPYKLWRADIHKCLTCGYRIIGGFAPKHYMEHYEPAFNTELRKLDSVLSPLFRFY